MRKVRFVALIVAVFAASVLCVKSVSAAEKSAATIYSYDHSEFFKGTTAGQKSAAPSVKGTLNFSTDKKAIEFLDGKKSSVSASSTSQ